ncbi:hypothetical protein BDA99DRAFT_494216 [Phascolomyces articulosus]|uniref:Wax synthase domain-containing protein n=1 Tax=Phascolomyces articulosus TaxID=60185 RepID=A0AAD5KAE8_9FUNG|nr:hypothetical protein BDA99DRAFT_494216 [Phascolomyces articulosus]
MQTLETFYQAGDTRLNVGTFIFSIFGIPTGLLALMLIQEKMSTTLKQILSIPLLTIVFFTPILFTCGNGVFDLVQTVACYNLFLRLFEFYWISPLLYGKSAYATRDYLYTEFWAALCKFPKPNKKKDDDTKPKVYVKDKKWYHIVSYMAYHAVICDIFGSWWSTFTGPDVIMMRQDRPLLFFVFLFFIVFMLNSAFNMFGYALHLAHCIYYDGGSYSGEQWRSLMKNPIMSTSLEELWSFRWHQLLHTSWVAFGFRPARYITQRLLAKRVKNPLPIALFVGTLAVFAVSGSMHEYIIYANVGSTIYFRSFIGQQLFFFFIHGVGMTLERFTAKFAKKFVPPTLLNSFLVKEILQRVWVISYAFLTFPFFIDGFAYWGLWADNPFVFTRPLVFEFFRSIPYGHALCGSLL